MICQECGKECKRTTNNQRFCAGCGPAAQARKVAQRLDRIDRGWKPTTTWLLDYLYETRLVQDSSLRRRRTRDSG